MSEQESRPAGYDFGTPQSARSPLSAAERADLIAASTLTDTDREYLRRAGEVLREHAGEMVDTWRAEIARQPHLARYSARPDGDPNPDYAAASKPRFAQWIVDVCTRPYDAAWADYQEEIGLRHTRAKKNQTDGADSAPHIPLRYVIAFTGFVLVSSKEFLARGGDSATEVEAMYAAWTKAVLLHIALWSRPYARPGDW
ncbi:MAG TPA: protoglobin domain-containing protein [Mycobacteriales bacterium]|nr:protoglobin domain-containing protein [Mycobacteriales bacterium]